jgi:RNA polymerase sigma factor (TIGR02999 family)
MLKRPPGLSWRAHFRATVGLVRVEPEPRRSGIGPGRDAAGWFGTAPEMNEVTRILSAIERGEPQAAERLLPLVYDELRKLAAQRLAQEKPGLTLQATALVHEAYLRLVDPDKVQQWNSRGHFFAAAAEAMRRILIDRARRKRRSKHGGDRHRVDLDDAGDAIAPPVEDLLALDEALEKLSAEDKDSADLVKLRYFAGLSLAEAAEVLGLPARTAGRRWAYARAWLSEEMLGGADSGE